MKLKGIMASILVAVGVVCIPMTVNAETVDAVEDVEGVESVKEDMVSVLCSMPLTQTVEINNKDVNLLEGTKIDVQDSMGNIIFSSDLLSLKNTVSSFSNQFMFNVELPTWEIGDSYVFNFIDMPPSYAEGISVKTENGTIDFDAIKNANSNYNLSVPVTCYMGKTTIENEEGRREQIDVKVGIEGPLEFKPIVKHKYRTQYIVVDKNDEIIKDAEIQVTTDKGVYKSVKTGLGLNIAYFQTDTEKFVSYDIIYNGVKIYTEDAQSWDRITGNLETKYFKLYDVNLETLTLKSNYLNATISNPEKVDFSLLGENGSLGIELELTSKSGNKVTAIIDGTGYAKLLDGILADTYIIKVKNDKGLNVELGETQVEVKGNVNIDIKLRANKVLALTNKDANEVENPFSYMFVTDTVLGDKKFESEYTKYYAVNNGTYTIRNVETEKDYDVSFIDAEKRVKVLNLYDGSIVSSDKVEVGEGILNPDTSDNIIEVGILTMCGVIGLIVLFERKRRNHI